MGTTPMSQGVAVGGGSSGASSSFDAGMRDVAANALYLAVTPPARA